MANARIELKDHPAQTKNPLSGETVPLFPNERSIWMTPANTNKPIMIGYCGIGPATPINLIVPPSVLPTRFRDEVVEIIKAERVAAAEAEERIASENSGGARALSELEIDQNILRALAEAEISTVQQAIDFDNDEENENGLASVPGLNDSTAEMVRQAYKPIEDTGMVSQVPEPSDG